MQIEPAGTLPSLSRSRHLRAIPISVLLTIHLCGAAAWWWLMPSGFPPGHSRFWMNLILPGIVLTIGIAMLVARWRGRIDRWRTIPVFFPAMWLAAAVSGIFLFPVSFRIVSPMLAVVAGVMYLACRPVAWRENVTRLCFVAGFSIGFIAPTLEHAREPRTQPLDPPIDRSVTESYVSSPGLSSLGVQSIRADVRVSPNSGTVSAQFGQVNLDIAPLLTFISRSPDGCWTIFAPPRDRRGPSRSLDRFERADDAVRMWFGHEEPATLEVRADDPVNAGRTTIESFTKLPRDVYSHLNTFTEVIIVGHRKLQVAFSPCGDERFDVTFSDYPFGKPARFAYFDAAAERLRVVEASNAEKGPFRTLGEGPLKRGEPLVITLFDRDRAVGCMTFDDWNAQASDETSPTAGWLVPANSIVFALYFDQPNSVAGIWLSLADTGVGRGWDSVGHRAGTYRNRVHLAPATQPRAPSE